PSQPPVLRNHQVLRNHRSFAITAPSQSPVLYNRPLRVYDDPTEVGADRLRVFIKVPTLSVAMKSLGSILLISCSELGHQPSGLAMPMAFLKRASIEADAMDVSVQGFDVEKARSASFVGISVPMHTALRLGVKIAQAIRRINSDCHICLYGLYASLN